MEGGKKRGEKFEEEIKRRREERMWKKRKRKGLLK